MKMLMMLCVLFLSITSVNAGEVKILPICLVEGPVQFEVYSDYLEGKIGTSEIQLTRYNDFIYGDIKGVEVRMNAKKQVLVGTIGHTKVQWQISAEGYTIFGYQNCILENAKVNFLEK